MIRSSIVIVLFLVSFSDGQRYRIEKDKIVGGYEVDIKNYPYQAAILVKRKSYCGGSIISRDWILTAAHCLENKKAEQFTVRVGSSYSKRGGDIHSVTTIIVHENYVKKTFDYDIGLMQLNSSITAKNARAIPLPSFETAPPANSLATVTGWGRLSYKGPRPAVLHMVEVLVISRSDCRRVYGKKGVTKRMFCAGFLEGGKDSCQGDSGGPAVVGGVLYGIVSWGAGCGGPISPGVYTNVAVFVPWIEEFCIIHA